MVARIVATLLLILAVHWLDNFRPWYFLVVAAAAGILFASRFTPVPGFRALSRLGQGDRRSIWIVLSVCAIVGYLHNANTWVADGMLFFRPADVSLWKSELILSIAVAAPLVHWLLGAFAPWVASMNGRRFASEFALYVNFSGIALLLWTGEATVSATTVGALAALLVLVELTLSATE